MQPDGARGGSAGLLPSGGGGTDPEDPDPEDPEEPEFPDDPDPSGPTDEELEAVGLVAVNKMAADVSNGNVNFYKNVGYALTGISFPANANSILYSSAATLEAARSNQLLLRGIGNSLSGVATAIGAYQTFIAFSDSTLTTGEILNLISTGLGITSLVTAAIPMVSIPTGITGAVIGMISVFFNECVFPGDYKVMMESGQIITLSIRIV